MSYSFRIFLSGLTWLAALFLEGAMIMAQFPLDAETEKELRDFVNFSFALIFPPLIEFAVLLFFAGLLLVISLIPARILWNFTARYAEVGSARSKVRNRHLR